MSDFLTIFQIVVPYSFWVVVILPMAGVVYAAAATASGRRRMTRLSWSFGRAGAVLWWATLLVWVALLMASGVYAYGIGQW